MVAKNEVELKKSITGKAQKVYYVYGDEKFLIKHFSTLAKEKIAGENPFSYHSFSGHEKIEEISQAINLIPFMGGQNYVNICDFDINALSDNDFEKFTAQVSNIDESTTVFISQITLSVDHKKSKAKKFLSVCDEVGVVAKISKRDEKSLQRQIISWATKSGCTISNVNAQKILFYCGNDLSNLKNEISKLCAYCINREITREDIEKLTTKKIEARIFDLSKYILQNDNDKAFTLLNDLLSNREEPTVILAILSTTYIDMYRVKVANESGKNYMELVNVFDYKRKEFRLKHADRYASKLSLDTIKYCIHIITSTEKDMKSLRADKSILLQSLVSKLLNIRGYKID